MPLITKVLKPEKFNAINIAVIMWPQVTGEAQDIEHVDQVQAMLDGLIAAGILGE